MGSRDYSVYFHNCEVEVWSCELSAVFLGIRGLGDNVQFFSAITFSSVGTLPPSQ